MEWFRSDNTEGFDEKTLKEMNSEMDKVYSNLSEEEKNNESYLDYLKEQILAKYDGSERMNVKTVLHGIVKRIDNDLYMNEDKRVMHKTDEFRDMYFNAHNGFMPDDIIYSHIYHIISEIETYLRYNTEEYDVIDDLIDELTGEIYVEPDQYTSALLEWVSSNLNRYAIADDLYQKNYKYGSLFDLLQMAQSIEIEEVKMSLLNDLRSMLEEEEEE
jgi:hypothetical protein